MNKLQAFTLLELAVVLALTSVVFSLGYMAYGMVVKSYGNFQTHQDQQLDQYALASLFNVDFQACESIELDQNALTLVDRGKRVSYQNLDGYLLRNQTFRIDTFYNCAWIIQGDSLILQQEKAQYFYSLQPKKRASWP
ncbi:prepilin-type N-terminal cleavage/methylation domain-containing protein [bacterium SCSIO 12741]|nr:prepilin-type N-terminal cleavage/methylation domain-containing protein [bacterium SCSIO 12741]